MLSMMPLLMIILTDIGHSYQILYILFMRVIFVVVALLPLIGYYF